MLDEHDTFVGKVVGSVKGLKLSTEAMKACGMQTELAAHLMLQCQSMRTNIILRAGSPPVYNQRRGSKTGLNLTKTSTQGLFKGSLAEDKRFARVKEGKGIGHNEKDALHLALPLKHPAHQHTVPLPVTMQDILRELGPNGDMVVLGCEKGKLRLAYKEGKGDEDFTGQFIIDLSKGDSTPIFYTRPWDRPDHQQGWNATKGIINKPEALAAVPDELYEKVFGQIFTVGFSDSKSANISPSDIKEAKVFANTPRISADLLDAIRGSQVLKADTPENRQTKIAIEHMDARTPMKDILAVLSEEQVKGVYDECGLVTTGDWDGLALGHPPPGGDHAFPPEKMRIYNTFKPGADGLDEIDGLVSASCDYVEHLKRDPAIANTSLGRLLQTIDEPSSLFSEFAIKRAGCVTPHEFVFQQLINYSYRDEQNTAYGEQFGWKVLQSSMDVGLATFAEKKQSGTLTPDEQFESSLNAALKSYRDIGNQNSGFNPAHDPLMEEHLSKHLKIAIESGETTYKIPHPHFDHNIKDLFQHGFDMRNPYGSNLEGAWFMITNEGALIYGETQEQLVETLLVGDFLKENIIDVSHGADMAAGWGKIIERQVELGQTIPPKTLEKYNTWKTASQQISQETRGVNVQESISTNMAKFTQMKKQLKSITEQPLAEAEAVPSPLPSSGGNQAH